MGNFDFRYKFGINNPDIAQKETHGNCQPQHSFYFSRETWRIQPCSEDGWKEWGGKRRRRKLSLKSYEQHYQLLTFYVKK